MSMVSKRRNTARWLWLILPIFALVGWFYPVIGFAMLICMLAPVLVAAVRGRHWCGWMCPRGAFYDYIMSRVAGKRKAPRWLRGTAFRTGMLIFLMGMMGVQMAYAWPDPVAMGRVFIVLLIVTTLVGVVLALFYPARTWCSFCPMGTLASWVGKGKRPLRVAESCRDCGVCSKACPMQLAPHKPDATHADCLKCTVCTDKCPLNALSFAEETTESLAKKPADAA